MAYIACVMYIYNKYIIYIYISIIRLYNNIML